MALESAKCPNCAATIQVPSDKENAFCTYCGSQIKTKAAIGYYQVEVVGKVQIDVTPAVQVKLQRGRETQNAAYFREALDIDPNCYDARLSWAEMYFQDFYYGNLFYRIHQPPLGNKSTWDEKSRLLNFCGFDLGIKYLFNPYSDHFMRLREADQVQLIKKAAKAFVDFSRTMSRISMLDYISHTFNNLVLILTLAHREKAATKKEILILSRCAKVLFDECVAQNLFVWPEKLKGGEKQYKREYEESIAKLKQLEHL